MSNISFENPFRGLFEAIILFHHILAGAYASYLNGTSEDTEFNHHLWPRKTGHRWDSVYQFLTELLRSFLYTITPVILAAWALYTGLSTLGYVLKLSFNYAWLSPPPWFIFLLWLPTLYVYYFFVYDSEIKKGH